MTQLENLAAETRSALFRHVCALLPDLSITARIAPATTENFVVGTRGLVESLSTAVGRDALTAQAASAGAVIAVASGIL
jgi:hypothetical protein